MLQNEDNCLLLKTKQLYDSAGLSYKFNMADTETGKERVNRVMTKLSDQFIQDWLTLLNKPGGRKENVENKLRMYKFFKQVFQKEFYLTCVTTTKYRVALTKLRVSSHHLAIETGRYHKPSALPVEQRLCASCAQVRDELHLLCHCSRMN